MDEESKVILALEEAKITYKRTYKHRYEYRTRDKNGVWSEPEFRCFGATGSETQARKTHEKCEDYEYPSGEHTLGYSAKNCTLVQVDEYVITVETEI